MVRSEHRELRPGFDNMLATTKGTTEAEVPGGGLEKLVASDSSHQKLGL